MFCPFLAPHPLACFISINEMRIMNKSNWPVCDELNHQNIADLFENKIAAIVVKNFLDTPSCQKWSAALKEFGLAQYDYNFDLDDAPPAAHLMTTHYLFETDEFPIDYAKNAEDSWHIYNQLSQKTDCDVLKKLDENFLLHGWQLQTPKEWGQNYSRIMARNLKYGALLHADFAPFVPGTWAIKNIDAEFAWNIHIDCPEQGGHCLVYNRPWNLEDDKHISGHTYGYDRVVVENCDFVSLKPEVGHLIIFNSRNFHQVISAPHDRLTLGGHMGRTQNNICLSWV